MSSEFLHLISPGRDTGVAVIAGDTQALCRLRDVLDDAIAGGAGAARFFCSDGDCYAMIVVREEDMGSTHTAYANEKAPLRSLRETRPVQLLVNYPRALLMLRNDTVPEPESQWTRQTIHVG